MAKPASEGPAPEQGSSSIQIVHTGIVVAILATASAFAAPDSYHRDQVYVQTGGLDLKSRAGQRQLDLRLEAALSKLCGEPVLFTRDEAAGRDACKAEACAAAALHMKAAIARAGTVLAIR